MSNSQDNAVALLRQRKVAEAAKRAETIRQPAPNPRVIESTASVEADLEWKQFSTMLPKALIKTLRAAAVEHDVEIRELVRRAVERELELIMPS
jgi:hypothetical protein